MSTVTYEAVIDFLRSGGGQTTYSAMKHKFAYYLKDPVHGDVNRQQFKEVLKKISAISQQKDGERIITLKEKYRDNNNVSNNTTITSKHDTSTTQIAGAAKSAQMSTSKDSGFSQSIHPGRPDSSVSSSSDPAALQQHKQWLTAIANGDIEAVKKLLNEKPELLDDCDSSLGYTAFHWAAASGNCELVEFLTSRTKSPESVNRISRAGHTPLHVAYMHNCIAAAHLLEKRGADTTSEDYSCRQPVYYRMQPRRGQTDASPTLSTGGRKVSTLEKMGHLASKLRDKVRSISSSNSSIESISSSSSTSNARRPAATFGDGFDSAKSKTDFDTDTTRKRNDPRFIRGLSSSIGAVNAIGMQLTPHIAISHLPCSKSKSTDLSPTVQESRSKSSDLMPPPPRPLPSSRV